MTARDSDVDGDWETPEQEFLEEMALVLETDEEFRKRQVHAYFFLLVFLIFSHTDMLHYCKAARRAASAPKEPEAPPFPHPDWRRGFHFKVDECNPSLHMKSKYSVKNLPDGSGVGSIRLSCCLCHDTSCTDTDGAAPRRVEVCTDDSYHPDWHQSPNWLSDRPWQFEPPRHSDPGCLQPEQSDEQE